MRVCLLISAGFLCAAANAAFGRADVPWVSLEHQRALRARAEKGQPADAPKAAKPADSSAAKTPKKTSKIAPKLTADKFEYAADGSGALVASGNAAMESDSFSVRAGKISYAQKINAARVMDDVRIAIDKNRVITSAADISLDGQKVKSDNIRFGSFPLFMEADSVEGDEKTYVLENAKTYFGEPASGTFAAESSKSVYDKQTKMIHMEDVLFKIDAVPVMYLPSMDASAETKFPFEIQNRLKYNGDYGASIQNTIHYKGFEDFAPGVLIDGYWKRSVLFGPALKYNVNSAENRMKGFVQAGFIHDTGDDNVLGKNSFGTPIDADRYFVEFRHNQIIKERFGLTAVVSAWSDEFVTRDFREDFFYNNQYPDNFAEAVYYGDMWTGSLFARFAPNDWQFIQQRLPEARFDVQPVALANTGAYLRGFASAAYLHQYNPYPMEYSEFSATTVESSRVDGYVGVDRPVEIGQWAKITPVAGVRGTGYFNALNGDSTYLRALAQIGFDAQMDVWGDFDFTSKTMGIDGLRHRLTPLVSYRYIPAADQGKDRIKVVDYDYFTTYPPVLDLGAMRNIDEMSPLNTMRFGLQNVFETRDAVYGSRELARVDLYQDVNFSRRRPPLRHKYWDDDAETSQRYSELFVNASVSPVRWFTVGTFSRASVEHSCMPEINTYMTLAETDMVSLTLGSAYLRDSFEQYYLSAEYRVSERYQFFGSWHYDSALASLVYQRYGLRTRVGNTWIIEYFFTHRTGSTREDSSTFGVNIVVLGM